MAVEAAVGRITTVGPGAELTTPAQPEGLEQSPKAPTTDFGPGDKALAFVTPAPSVARWKKRIGKRCAGRGGPA
jgi:hypothetical protein